MKPLFFVLITWILAGTLQAETPLDGSNSWPFDLPKDSFTDDALLDLRDLNEQ